MMKLLLLALALGWAGAAPVEGEGQGEGQGKDVCPPHSRPWQVNLLDSETGASCSGALISEWWVLTASYLCQARPGYTVATLGDHDLSVEEGAEQRIAVSQAVYHGAYGRSPLHSMALLRLATPARLGAHVAPVALPTRCPQAGEVCTVSGWGSTVRQQNEPRRLLKCKTMPVIEHSQCAATHPMFWSHNMFCAGFLNSAADNCVSDVGSPVECGGELQGLLWLSDGCRAGTNPSTYSRVCNYRRWIHQVTSTFVPTTTAAPSFTTTAATSP